MNKRYVLCSLLLDSSRMSVVAVDAVSLRCCPIVSLSLSPFYLLFETNKTDRKIEERDDAAANKCDLKLHVVELL